MEIGIKKIETKINEKINLYFLGDIHEGNCNCNHEALKQAVKIIAEDQNAYWIGMGDYIEAITHMGDKRFDPLSISREYNINDLKDLPHKQACRVFEILKPIDNKCLALLGGNHEEKYTQYNSSDVYGKFVNMFESNPVKLGYVAFYNILLTSGGEDKTRAIIGIALNHGVGGGGYLEGYKINKCHQAFKYMYADINVMAHIHQLGKDRKLITTCSARGKLKKQKRIWGLSGCFLNAYVEGNTNYFEAKAGAGGESDIGMLKCSVWLTKSHEEYGWDAEMKEIYL